MLEEIKERFKKRDLTRTYSDIKSLLSKLEIAQKALETVLEDIAHGHDSFALVTDTLEQLKE